MGRIINETAVTSLADADVLLKDNPTTGSGKIAYSDLKNQVEIVARKNQASGYAGVAADGLLEPTIMRAALVPESVADDTAKNALTVVSGDIGRRLVYVVATGINYIAIATGSGSSKWQIFSSTPPASTSVPGIAQLATDAEAVAGTSTTLVPSVASMQAAIAPYVDARAPRQGLVFDGSVATVKATLGSALGIGDASIAAEFDVPSSNPATNLTVWRLATSLSSGTANELALSVRTTGALWVYKRGATTSDSRYAEIAGFVSAHGRQRVKVVITRSGAALTIYIDGVSNAYTETTEGTPPTWATTWDGTLLTIGLFGDAEPFSGHIGPVRIYNRRLSASEVLDNFRRGGPNAGDHNTASNTSLLSGNDSNFSAAGSWTLAGATTISGGKLNLSNADAASNTLLPINAGKPVWFQVTVDSITAGAVQYYNGAAWVNFAAGAGTYGLVFTPVATDAAGIKLRSSGGNAVLDAFTGARAGLLVSPALTAPGNGYQWQDASGNKADITLPTSGVAWALPDRRPNSVRGTLTWSATHEGKSLLGQRALPDGAAVTLTTSKATAGSSGSGKTIGTTNSATRWSTAATFTTAKKVDTLANQLPAGTADADNDIIVDPDTANFTGSIEVEAHYVLTQPN